MGSTTEHTVQRRRQRLSRYIVSSYEASRAQTALGGSYNSVGATPSTARLREEQARVLQRRGRSPSPDKDTVHSGHAQVGTGAPSGRAASPSPDPARPADDAGDSAPRQGEAAAGDSNSLDPIPDGGGDGPVETAKLLRRLCDLPMCLAGFLAVPHLVRCAVSAPQSPISLAISPTDPVPCPSASADGANAARKVSHAAPQLPRPPRHIVAPRSASQPDCGPFVVTVLRRGTPPLAHAALLTAPFAPQRARGQRPPLLPRDHAPGAEGRAEGATAAALPYDRVLTTSAPVGSAPLSWRPGRRRQRRRWSCSATRWPDYGKQRGARPLTCLRPVSTSR